jgi:hypothetical protein
MPAPPIRRALLGTASLALLASLAPTAMAADKQSASGIDIRQRPAAVRIAIVLPAGTDLDAFASDVEAVDAAPLDGRAVLRVRAAGLSVRSQDATGGGITVRLRPRPGGATILITGRRHALKFVSYGRPSGRRLVIDMWRNTTAAGARILNDGCLKLTRWGATPGIATARGRELQPLFEHGLVLSLRREGPGRSLIAETPVTATEGVFKADFSGYRIPGRWNGSLPFTLVPAPGTTRTRAMLEAWASSAKDGSLECLVQTPVILRPRTT